MIGQNSIEIITAVFGAGESRLFALSGEYFEVIDAPSPIDVVLSDFNGAQMARMSQAGAAFYSKSVAYGVIQITSASAQTVRFAYGSGEVGTRRATGSVSISGAVALDAPTLAALEQINISGAVALDAPTLAALEQINVRSESATASYKNIAVTVANTPEIVFLPSANTNGVLILGAGFGMQNTASLFPFSTFIAKSSAPASVTDGEIILTADFYNINGTLFVDVGQLSQQVVLPAGLGLYFITASAASPTSAKWVRYRFL